MEQVLQITAVCVLAALLAVVIRRGAPEVALLLGLGTVIIALLTLSGSLRELMNFFTRLNEQTGVSGEIFLPLYKTVGIALVVKIGSGLCKDAGAAALASAVEIAGAICALLVAIPLLDRVLGVLLELMG